MLFIFFILGLIVGSFINALVFRLHQGMSFTWVRSICPGCKKTLLARDLIPLLSFFWLKRSCRFCKRKISWQYPVVEFTTGLLFLISAWHFISQPQLVPTPSLWYLTGFFIILIFLIIIFLYDLKFYLILDKITLPAMLVAVVWNLGQNFSVANFLNLFTAAAIGAGFFWLQYIVSRGRWIGGGDIRLGALMGFILGWPQILTALMVAYIIGAVFSLFMLLLKKKTWGSQIPFGTFLTIATFITMLWGRQLVDWYFSWL